MLKSYDDHPTIKPASKAAFGPHPAIQQQKNDPRSTHSTHPSQQHNIVLFDFKLIWELAAGWVRWRWRRMSHTYTYRKLVGNKNYFKWNFIFWFHMITLYCSTLKCNWKTLYIFWIIFIHSFYCPALMVWEGIKWNFLIHIRLRIIPLLKPISAITTEKALIVMWLAQIGNI